MCLHLTCACACMCGGLVMCCSAIAFCSPPCRACCGGLCQDDNMVLMPACEGTIHGIFQMADCIQAEGGRGVVAGAGHVPSYD